MFRPLMAETRNRIRKTTKQIFAANAAVPAKAPNPRTAAINMITRNVIIQDNMVFSLSVVDHAGASNLVTPGILGLKAGTAFKERKNPFPFLSDWFSS